MIAFDKETSTPKSQSRIKKYEEAFVNQEIVSAGKVNPRYELLRRYCSKHLEPAVKQDRQGNALSFATANFKSAQFPKFFGSITGAALWRSREGGWFSVSGIRIARHFGR
ncbi:hypothetical protein OS189_01875 [Sulfitobacter sp. F26169L]|nr:hypothetical protein [Sulfitobacter sp. F26169L]